MNNNPLVSIKPEDTELFGEFKSAPKESSDFFQLNSKIDDIICQLGLLSNEVKELKQQLNISQAPSPDLLRPNLYSSTHYHNIPTYPGQPMPPYPYQHQHQHQSQRYNSHLNSFQANS